MAYLWIVPSRFPLSICLLLFWSIGSGPPVFFLRRSLKNARLPQLNFDLFDEVINTRFHRVHITALDGCIDLRSGTRHDHLNADQRSGLKKRLSAQFSGLTIKAADHGTERFEHGRIREGKPRERILFLGSFIVNEHSEEGTAPLGNRPFVLFLSSYSSSA